MACTISIASPTVYSINGERIVHVEGFITDCNCSRALIVSLSCIQVDGKYRELTVNPNDIQPVSGYPNKLKWSANFSNSIFPNSLCVCGEDGGDDISITVTCYGLDPNGNAVINKTKTIDLPLDCQPILPTNPNNPGGGGSSIPRHPPGNHGDHGGWHLCENLGTCACSALLVIAIGLIISAIISWYYWGCQALGTPPTVQLSLSALAFAAIAAWVSACKKKPGFCNMLKALYKILTLLAAIDTFATGILALWTFARQIGVSLPEITFVCLPGMLAACAAAASYWAVVRVIAENSRCASLIWNTDSNQNSNQQNFSSSNMMRMKNGGEKYGLGQAIKTITLAIGIPPCGGCQKRAEYLDNLFRFEKK